MGFGEQTPVKAAFRSVHAGRTSRSVLRRIEMRKIWNRLVCKGTELDSVLNLYRILQYCLRAIQCLLHLVRV